MFKVTSFSLWAFLLVICVQSIGVRVGIRHELQDLPMDIYHQQSFNRIRVASEVQANSIVWIVVNKGDVLLFEFPCSPFLDQRFSVTENQVVILKDRLDVPYSFIIDPASELSIT